MQTYKEMGRPSQISLLIGPALADLTALTEHYMPKAAIDKTTFRMGELLNQRWKTQQSSKSSGKGSGSNDVDDLI